jgi:hypothetical protein
LKSRSSFGTGTNMWLGLTSCMYFFSKTGQTTIYKTLHKKTKKLSNTNPTKNWVELRKGDRSCSTSGTRPRLTWSLKSRSSFGTGTNMWLGLTSCMYFFSLLYCSISNKSHVQTILVIVICFHQMFHISPFLSETTKKIV